MKNKENFISNRTNDYRKKFFLKNKGLFKEKFYFCSYCGKLKKKENITVDHLVPIATVALKKKISIYRIILKLLGISNINDVKNLVPACERCNKRKGKKTGIWIVAGLLGKCQWMTLLFWIAFCIFTIVIITIIITF